MVSSPPHISAPHVTPSALPEHRGETGLRAVSILTALLLAVPILGIVATLLFGSTTSAQFSPAYVLELASNSALLCALVGIGVGLLGTGAAWLVARFEFAGRRAFEWLLVLPLAMPAYVMAYAYTDALQYAGPVQSGLRELMQWNARGDYWFPDVRTLPGAATVLTLALYPYVYLLARVAFLEQPNSTLEVARTFGLTRWQAFVRISLPMARPAIIAGVALAMMETLADYGTVSYFGVSTFTTGIFSAWFAQGDRVAAVKLAAVLMAMVFFALWMEQRARRFARFHSAVSASATRRPLTGGWSVAAIVASSIPLACGFVVPVLLLIRLAMSGADFASAEEWITGRFTQMAINSVSVACLSAMLAVAIALLLAYHARRARGTLPTTINRLVGMGYALPGLVIAVGVLLPLVTVDQALTALVESIAAKPMPLLLTGGLVALIYAYLVRFLGVALGSVDSGLQKITPQIDEAARALGSGALRTGFQIHAPMLKNSLVTAALLVFVDVIKELPATLVLRPFNFDTLAVQTYTLAMDERLPEASIAALVIIGVGLIPVMIASKTIAAPNRAASRDPTRRAATRALAAG